MASAARLSLAAFFIIALAGAALAEVCDKMNPRWSPGDGPVGQIDSTLSSFANPFGITLLVVLAIGFVLNRWWIHAFTAVLAGVMAWFHIAERWFGDTVYAGAISEGCLAEPYALLAMLAVLFGWSVWGAFKARNGRRH